jgi:hypothetical protein
MRDLVFADAVFIFIDLLNKIICKIRRDAGPFEKQDDIAL